MKSKQQKEKRKELIDNNRQLIRYIKLLNGCKYCDENDPDCLEFHHINPKDKKNKISNLLKYGYSLATIKEEMEKCSLLCSNCHSKIHQSILKGKIFIPPKNKIQNFNVKMIEKIQNFNVKMIEKDINKEKLK